MVDFAVVLNPDDVLSGALARLPMPQDGGIRSFNQTRLSTVIDKPIVVSIETKREREGFSEGRTQLSVWAAAYFNHLKNMVEAKVAAGPTNGLHPPPLPAFPFHPLILVQGPAWAFLAATRSPTGETVSSQRNAAFIVDSR